MTRKEGHEMAKWKKIADSTANSGVYRRAYLRYLEHGGLYRKWDYNTHLRHGRDDKYKSRRKGRC